MRRLILSGSCWRQYVPAACTYENAVPHALLWGEKAMLARLRGMEQADWAGLRTAPRGCGRRSGRPCRRQPDYERILEASKSKRYPRTRLQRLLLCAYLGIDAQALLCEAPYVRVLAFDEMGRAVLRQAKKTGGLPLVNAGQTRRTQRMARWSAAARRSTVCLPRSGALPRTNRARLPEMKKPPVRAVFHVIFPAGLPVRAEA